MDKATLEDPVREMFYSHETMLPDKVVEGLLPNDVYSRLSFLTNSDRRSSIDEKEVRELVELRPEPMQLPFPPQPTTPLPLPTPLTSTSPAVVSSGRLQQGVRFSTDVVVHAHQPFNQIPNIADEDGDGLETKAAILSLMPISSPVSTSCTRSDIPFNRDNSDPDPDLSLIEGADEEGQINSAGFNDSGISAPRKQTVVSADDFLPMFTYMLVQADLPQLLLVKEMMTNLIDDEETYGECGYYLATLEAATQHICDLAAEFKGQK